MDICYLRFLIKKLEENNVIWRYYGKFDQQRQGAHHDPWTEIDMSGKKNAHKES